MTTVNLVDHYSIIEKALARMVDEDRVMIEKVDLFLRGMADGPARSQTINHLGGYKRDLERAQVALQVIRVASDQAREGLR